MAGRSDGVRIGIWATMAKAPRPGMQVRVRPYAYTKARSTQMIVLSTAIQALCRMDTVSAGFAK